MNSKEILTVKMNSKEILTVTMNSKEILKVKMNSKKVETKVASELLRGRVRTPDIW